MNNTTRTNRRPESAVPSPLSPEKYTGSLPPQSVLQSPQPPQPTPTPAQPEHDIWDTLCGADGIASLPYDTTISSLTTSGIPVGCSPGGTISGGALDRQGISDPRGNTPLSDVLLPENSLLYLTEDVPVFGIWEDATL
jgi:hypothetical protein